MPSGNLVNISQLYDKNIFARKATNIRSLPSVELGKILRTVKAGDRIGMVQSHVNGYKNSYSEKDGAIWLQLYPVKGENSGKPAYTKLFPDMLDWASLEEQGAMTVEQQKEAEEEKNKSNFDKIMDNVKGAGKWILLGWVTIKVLDNKKSR